MRTFLGYQCLYPKRFIFLFVIAASVATYFWTASRYPDLNNKAMMAESGSVSDTLSVYPKYKVQETDPFYLKVSYTTLNWIRDNKKGMTFGVVFSGLLLAMLSYLRLVRAPSTLGNTTLGVLIGSPLAVCVNCAAPVFKGMLQSKRVETAFAAMLSSPTLNIIVLTMAFSLFPLYMAVTKVAFTLTVIFIGVPLLKRFLGDDHAISDLAPKNPTPEMQVHNPNETDTWLKSPFYAVKDFLSCFKFIVIKTVPLMFLAGFLGALVSHMIPLEYLGSNSGILAVVITALVGVILPTPMAFDVMLSNAFYSQNLLPVNLILVLLCTLGIFSVYSFFIVWSSASLKWATNLGVLVLVLGIGVGLTGKEMHNQFYGLPNLRAYHALRNSLQFQNPEVDKITSSKFQEPAPRDPISMNSVQEAPGMILSSFPFFKPAEQAKGKFTKLEGSKIGLTRGHRYGIRDYPDPFWIGRGTASGDYNNDGWTDIMFGSDVGIALYKNRGGWFELQNTSFPALDSMIVYSVSFVDMNNDGWLDIFYSTFANGNFLVVNNKGEFDFNQPKAIPNYDGIITVSPSFADLDGNGYVDVVNGNMALGIVTAFHHYGKGRLNSITFNDNLNFTEKELPGYSGETMASLVSDLNNDDKLDIYFSNDFIVPDNVLLGDGKGSFTVDNKLIAQTPYFSMSADTGDFDNNGVLDFLVMGTVVPKPGVETETIDGITPAEFARPKTGLEYCETIQDEIIRQNCSSVRKTNPLLPFYRDRNVSLKDCEKISTDNKAKQDCLLSAMWVLILRNEIDFDCDKEFQGDAILVKVCHLLAHRGSRYKKEEFAGAMQQKSDHFLYRGDAGSLADVNAQSPKFSHPGGWTWGGRFADFDNDGLLDIFNSEGVVAKKDSFGWNVLMKNTGMDFIQKQFSYNATDNFDFYSFSYIDFDNDGDLDIIGNSSIGAVQVYMNEIDSNHSVSIALRDHKKNRFGIGAKISITANDGSTYFRELKQSGGYQSSDSPVAFFGVKDSATIESIKVEWPDGEKQTYASSLPVNHAYVLERL
ncbi:MAG: FG-GAP-like repeat-containing protein [Oligoflexales bacterium]